MKFLHATKCALLALGLSVANGTIVSNPAHAQTLPPGTIAAYSTLVMPLGDCVQQLLETVFTASTVTYVVSDLLFDGCKGHFVAKGPPLPPGTYTVTAKYRSGQVVGGFIQPVIVASAPATTTVFALFHVPTSTHFVTASESDRSALLASGWIVAESGFVAWPSAGPAPPAARPVCRFFFPAKATHFYTANESDCASLKRTAGFVDEGIAFRALVPYGGQCGPGTRPVYRLFDPARVNHRYTLSVDTVAGMVTSTINQNFNELPDIPSSWRDEGIAFCSPIQ